MPRKYLFAIIFLALLTFATAEEPQFAADIKPEQVKTKSNETAMFDFSISHLTDNLEYFEVFSPDILWDIRTKDNIQVQPDRLFLTKLLIRPLNPTPGVYGVPIQIKRAGTNEIIKKILRIEVTSPYPPAESYLPAVRGTTFMQEKIDPREPATITVVIENQNRRILPRVEVKLRSNVINKDYVTSLNPVEKKELKFTVELSPHTAPQMDVLRTTIIIPESEKAYQFDLEGTEYFVKRYGKLEPKEEITKSFLMTKRSITLTNGANDVVEEDYTVYAPWYQRWFTSTEPKAQRIKGYFVWPITLEIGQSQTLTLKTNYIPLTIALIIAAILTIIYHIYRSPVKIIKKATIVATREGGISELKILLEVKNRSKEVARNISILDLVPRIAEYIKDSEAGTIAPINSIRNEKKGTILKYVLEHLDPSEERIISYRIRSKLSILGGVSLPVAVAKLETAKGRIVRTSSNIARITFLG